MSTWNTFSQLLRERLGFVERQTFMSTDGSISVRSDDAFDQLRLEMGVDGPALRMYEEALKRSRFLGTRIAEVTDASRAQLAELEKSRPADSVERLDAVLAALDGWAKAARGLAGGPERIAAADKLRARRDAAVKAHADYQAKVNAIEKDRAEQLVPLQAEQEFIAAALPRLFNGDGVDVLISLADPRTQFEVAMVAAA